MIDYGASNLHSVVQALQAVSTTNDDIIVTNDPHALDDVHRIVLPGQGAFNQIMHSLDQSGMRGALERQVIRNGKPYLGICLGMQILASSGTEHGMHQGLGWLPGQVRKIAGQDLRIPHMGWNDINWRPHPFRQDWLGDAKDTDFYFAHSFAFYPDDDAHSLGTVDYGGVITAAVGRDNIVGIQAHPEKSQRAGLDFLSAFLRWQI